jgi:isoleucyl-tRNA synthetase
MAYLFENLTRWLAPILCFTAEEAWQQWPHKNGHESIHLAQFNAIPASWQDDALAEKWDRIREVRKVITGALERARADKIIGSSLQANPTVYVDAETHALLSVLDIADICITSSLQLKIASVPAGAFTLPEVVAIGVVVDLAEGQKCERCWRILKEVGTHKAHSTLCLRCVDAVGN